MKKNLSCAYGSGGHEQNPSAMGMDFGVGRCFPCFFLNLLPAGHIIGESRFHFFCQDLPWNTAKIEFNPAGSRNDLLKVSRRSTSLNRMG